MTEPDAPQTDPPPPGTFAYEAQSADGQTFRGTLDAPAIEAAADQLKALQLRVTRLEPAAAAPQPRGATLAEGDVLFVNRQLAHLTAGGLPMEKGLRLIADELPRRQAAAVRAIAADLEGGVPLGDAFAGRSGMFPPAYGHLLAAGVRANALPGVLANLGRHVEMVQRLRAAVWRAATYPLLVALALLAVMVFIWGYVIPHTVTLAGSPDLFRPRFYYYGGPPPPPPTDLTPVVTVARLVSYAVIAGLVVVLAAAAAAGVMARSAGGRRALEPLLRPLPVVGPVVRWNQVARWCDALHLAVDAGMDLPAALDLAGRSVDSAAALADADQMASAVRAGQSIEPPGRLRLLPMMVPAALAMGVQRNDLPATAATLARLYQEQAEVRLAVVPQVLSPALLLLTAACVTLAVGAAMIPLVAVLRALTRV